MPRNYLDRRPGQPDPAAGWKADHDAHRPRRIGLRPSLCRAEARDRGERSERAPREFVPPPEDPARGPLPAGHPRSWGVLTAGTVLEDTPYPLPVFAS
jgi:hypothetical protein